MIKCNELQVYYTDDNRTLVNCDRGSYFNYYVYFAI